ncbi:DUF2855 family protein [Sphingorhabdus sp. IMCC26285]|uniref:DUF2855 family protein n=1 Tax=Sphingorhabdus profundilacus TaxID=2509718 RepID=A0A6I4LW85_9SPHN|nr:DUF2855 family protein [Sphingorhabdus profundilacus]MVZ97139.1 DUF2855 family protein [Sphingorhabdus profundilacus]
MALASTVWIKKASLTDTHIHADTLPPLGDGEVRLKIESFSVTANNITYAVMGDMFGYWNFFPAEGDFGIVPMWGHAIVEDSRNPDVAIGERIYGYVPMGTHLDVLPGKVSFGGFTDMAAHRQPMSPVYNQYSRLNADPEHDPAKENERMLFGPLFKTGFLIESMFRREKWFGAKNLTMTSASSKTAMGLASVAKDLSLDIKRIGLTSKGNVAFVEKCGLFDQILAYEDIAQLPQEPSVSVDFAGNSQLLHDIHAVLGNQLKYSCLVGATHVEARGLGGGGEMAGPKPILFFAPDHAVASIQELGPKAFGEAVAKSWKSFLGAVDGVVAVDKRQGLDNAAKSFAETLEGRTDPQKGIIIHP